MSEHVYTCQRTSSINNTLRGPSPFILQSKRSPNLTQPITLKMHFPTLLVIALTAAATAGVSAKTITRVVDWPGYKTERACVQTALRQPTSAVYIGCTEYVCACNHFDVALSLVSSAARETCISANDVAAATSIIKGFCYQFPGVTASIPVCNLAFVRRRVNWDALGC